MTLRSVLLYLIFFCSGASALTFETLWFRQAGLALGNSVWAGSMVLAAFMAGLALGNWICGRFGDLARAPIRAYGFLEFLVGALGGLEAVSRRQKWHVCLLVMLLRF